MEPKEMMSYANTGDPLVTAFYEVLKSNAKRIMNDDIKYGKLTKEEIGQFFIDMIPDILDAVFVRNKPKLNLFAKAHELPSVGCNSDVFQT